MPGKQWIDDERYYVRNFLKARAEGSYLDADSCARGLGVFESGYAIGRVFAGSVITEARQFQEKWRANEVGEIREASLLMYNSTVEHDSPGKLIGPQAVHVVAE